MQAQRCRTEGSQIAHLASCNQWQHLNWLAVHVILLDWLCQMLLFTCCTIPDELDACLGEMEYDRALAQSIALCNGCASTGKGLPRQRHIQAIGTPCSGKVTDIRIARAGSRSCARNLHRQGKGRRCASQCCCRDSMTGCKAAGQCCCLQGMSDLPSTEQCQVLAAGRERAAQYADVCPCTPTRLQACYKQ